MPASGTTVQPRADYVCTSQILLLPLRDNFNVCRVAKILLTLFLDKGGTLCQRILCRDECKKGRRGYHFLARLLSRGHFPNWPACLSLWECNPARSIFQGAGSRSQRKPAGIMLCLGPISQTRRPPPGSYSEHMLPLKTIILMCATGK
jgi:hypothetical protein